MKTKILLLFAALALSAGVLFAAKVQIGGIYYSLDATTLTATVISGTSKYSGSVAIPVSVKYDKIYSVKSINVCAFKDCTGLTSVTIGDSVTVINSEAFYNCTGLTSVTIGNSVTYIESRAFYGCRALTSVTIPNSVTEIVIDAFAHCYSLRSVTIGNSVTYIGDKAFWCCRLRSVTIPNSVTTIGTGAFYGCEILTSVTFNADSCITMGSSNGYHVFSGCTNLATVTIGDNVKNIPAYAFKGCSGLTSVKCLAETPPKVDSSSFSRKDTLYLPLCNNIAAYKTADVWKDFKVIKPIEALQVTVSVSKPRGSVIGSGMYCPDSEAIIQATANPHYHFVKWNDDNTDNPRTVMVTQDSTFVAEFAIDSYMVTLKVNDSIMGSVTGAGTYTYATQATIEAIPNSGYEFVQWNDGNKIKKRTITVTTNVTYTATFKKTVDALSDISVIEGVFVRDGKIVIENNANADVYVYNSVGQLINYELRITNYELSVPQGLYIVKVGNQTMKVAVK